MLNFINRFLGRDIESKFQKYMNLQKSLNEINSEAKILAIDYESNRSMLDINPKESDLEKSLISDKFNTWLKGYTKEVDSLCKKRDSILKSINLLMCDDLKVKVGEYNQYFAIKKSYKDGKISRNLFNNIIKGRNKKVHYSDVIVFNEEGKILILHRTGKDNELEGGEWCLPGGHVDYGETHDEAAIRELMEETNICVKDVDLVITKDDKDAMINYYTARLDGEPTIILDSSEHDGSKWIDPHKEIFDFEFIYDLKGILIDYFKPTSDVAVIRKSLAKSFLGGKMSREEFLGKCKDLEKSLSELSKESVDKEIGNITKKDDEVEKSEYTEKEVDEANKKDEIKGGYADGMTVEQIAEKHGVSKEKIMEQVNVGKGVELEHTDDENKAIEIAMDHLYESANYYTNLAEMESKAEKEESVEKSFHDPQFDLEKAKAQIGEIRNWAEGRYRKVAEGKWVKVEEGGKEKKVADSSVKRALKIEINKLSSLIEERKKEFEKTLISKFPKNSFSYKVFFENAWSSDEQTSKFVEKIRDEQTSIKEEIDEMETRIKVEEKAEREAIVGKKELGYEDIKGGLNEVSSVFTKVDNDIPKFITAREAMPEVSKDDYFLDTKTTFKSVFGEGVSFNDEIFYKWSEMKDSGKYEHHKSPKSDSEYLIDNESGDIFRLSDHWGRVASCTWSLEGSSGSKWDIAKSNISNFERKYTGEYFNPVYREKMVEAAHVALPIISKFVNGPDHYLNLDALSKISSLNKRVFDNYLKKSANLSVDEIDNLKKKFQLI